MEIQGVKRGDGGLQGVTGDFKGLQEVTKVTAGYKGSQKNCFLTRTSKNTFSWSILHKHKSLRNLKFWMKTID